MTTPLPPGLGLPVDLVAVIYYCHVCTGKHSYGRGYFAETHKFPAACPGCSTPFVQDERLLRVEADTTETLAEKKTGLYAKRGQKLPAQTKPGDPDVIKQQRVHDLESELARLKGDDPARRT